MPRSINRWFLLGAIALAAPALARDRQSARPTESPALWFTDEDYPADAKRAGQQGRVAVRLTIDAAGRVSACLVTGSSGSALLDAKTCELVAARGKFAPALDEAGRPVASTYPLATRWSLGAPFPKASWRSAQILSIDSAGKVVNCAQFLGASIALSPTSACGRLTAMSPSAALQLRGGAGAVGLVPVTFEYSFRIDGDTAPETLAYAMPGAALISLQMVHFDVDAGGVVRNCRIVRRQGTPGADLCSTQIDRYAPRSVATGVTVSMAVSRSEGR